MSLDVSTWNEFVKTERTRILQMRKGVSEDTLKDALQAYADEVIACLKPLDGETVVWAGASHKLSFAVIQPERFSESLRSCIVAATMTPKGVLGAIRIIMDAELRPTVFFSGIRMSIDSAIQEMVKHVCNYIKTD
jgi:hypothetical protein